MKKTPQPGYRIRSLHAKRPGTVDVPLAPPISKIGKYMTDESAEFRLGERVVISPNWDEPYAYAIIDECFGLKLIEDEHGPYVDADGLRCSYKLGYMVRVLDGEFAGEKVFLPAHVLTREDCRPSHLKLVWPKPLESARLNSSGRS